MLTGKITVNREKQNKQEAKMEWEEIKEIMTTTTPMYNWRDAYRIMARGGFIKQAYGSARMVFWYKSVIIKREVQQAMIDIMLSNGMAKSSGGDLIVPIINQKDIDFLA